MNVAALFQIPSRPSSRSGGDDTPRAVRVFEIVFLVVAFAWFLAQTTYLAGHIGFGIAPDEIHHLHVSRAYHESSMPWIVDSPGTFYLGTVASANVPYLHHLVAGKLLALNLFGIDDRYFLRGISIFFGILFLLSVVELLREIRASPPVTMFSIGVLVNMPMLVFISSAASYDMLANLLAVRFHLSLLRFIRTRSIDDLLLAFVYLGAGSLTKVTILPFVIVAVAMTLIYARSVGSALRSFGIGGGGRRTVVVTLFVAVATLNGVLYGTNLVRYGKIFPTSEQVLGLATARQFSAESKVLHSLMQTRDERELMPIERFVGRFSMRVRETIFGIMGHKEFVQPRRTIRSIMEWRWVLLGGSICLVAALIWHRGKAWSEDSSRYLVLGLSGVFYFTFLVFYNYDTYLMYRVFGTSLQGRYVFPAIANLIIGIAALSFGRVPPVIGWMVALFGCYFFTKIGWISILPQLSADWFA